MKLNSPFQISARLLPAVRIGDAWISIKFNGATNDGRARYRYFIDLPDGTEHSANDLQSGCGGGSLQGGMESLLSFLGACAESVRYGTKYDKFGDGTDDDSNADLFPATIAEWAYQNSDEISMLQCELEENKNLITD